jgi:hypothetical protein
MDLLLKHKYKVFIIQTNTCETDFTTFLKYLGYSDVSVRFPHIWSTSGNIYQPAEVSDAARKIIVAYLEQVASTDFCRDSLRNPYKSLPVPVVCYAVHYYSTKTLSCVSVGIFWYQTFFCFALLWCSVHSCTTTAWVGICINKFIGGG